MTENSVNATPLIDVVMCLIVFFLIVGKMATDRGVPVRLPQTAVGQDEPSASIVVITVSRAAEGVRPSAPGTGGWLAYGIVVQLDGDRMQTPKDLEAAIRAKVLENPNVSVQIRGDRELAFGSMEPVFRALGQGGAKSVRLATERLP